MTRPPFFIYQTFLPSRQRDCFTPTSLSIPTTLSKPHPPPCLTPPFQNRTIPSPFAMLTSVCADTLSHPHHHSPHTNILASLVKGEVLSPEKIRATTGGIVPPSLATTKPFQNRTITIAFRRGASLLLPLNRTSLSPQPSQKDDNPLLRTNPPKTALSPSLFVGE